MSTSHAIFVGACASLILAAFISSIIALYYSNEADKEDGNCMNAEWPTTLEAVECSIIMEMYTRVTGSGGYKLSTAHVLPALFVLILIGTLVVILSWVVPRLVPNTRGVCACLLRWPVNVYIVILFIFTTMMLSLLAVGTVLVTDQQALDILSNVINTGPYIHMRSAVITTAILLILLHIICIVFLPAFFYEHIMHHNSAQFVSLDKMSPNGTDMHNSYSSDPETVESSSKSPLFQIDEEDTKTA